MHHQGRLSGEAPEEVIEYYEKGWDVLNAVFVGVTGKSLSKHTLNSLKSWIDLVQEDEYADYVNKLVEDEELSKERQVILGKAGNEMWVYSEYIKIYPISISILCILF